MISGCEQRCVLQRRRQPSEDFKPAARGTLEASIEAEPRFVEQDGVEIHRSALHKRGCLARTVRRQGACRKGGKLGRIVEAEPKPALPWTGLTGTTR